MFVVLHEKKRKFIDHSEGLSGLTEQALSDCPATFVDTTNVIHTLKLLACHNSG